MKIGNFINVAFVDLLSDVYLLSKDDLKNNHWLNSENASANVLQI